MERHAAAIQMSTGALVDRGDSADAGGARHPGYGRAPGRPLSPEDAAPTDAAHERICVAPAAWRGSFATSESTLHQLSPYIGKLKSGMATELIRSLSVPGDVVFDPFAGSGTVALEAWRAGRHVVANDLNPYATVLLKAKLSEPMHIDAAQQKLRFYDSLVRDGAGSAPAVPVPEDVCAFFHPQTLAEAIAWSTLLTENSEWFLLACLLGILHHQRPGFLSYPASHAVPYLRTRRFPRDEFSELYEYRPVFDRLESKVRRALSRVPALDGNLRRTVLSVDAAQISLSHAVDAIITSPPYMSRLSYARDNRLRLWFLGVSDGDPLDRVLSPTFERFTELMKRCVQGWRDQLRPDGYCALVLGNEEVGRRKLSLPGEITRIVLADGPEWRLVETLSEPIPPERRVRRNASGSKSETILVFQRSRSPNAAAVRQ